MDSRLDHLQKLQQAAQAAHLLQQLINSTRFRDDAAQKLQQDRQRALTEERLEVVR